MSLFKCEVAESIKLNYAVKLSDRDSVLRFDMLIKDILTSFTKVVQKILLGSR
jgi:hypothetical protein